MAYSHQNTVANPLHPQDPDGPPPSAPAPRPYGRLPTSPLFTEAPVDWVDSQSSSDQESSMATEAASLPINGMYHGPEDPRFAEERVGTTATVETRAAQPAEIPKDQVAWYFVEQYYTTMSKNPDKLHLFFNKRSQFVFGVEAEKEILYTGQKAINERIKEIAFSDCKVRVTNVDSQNSGDNIVIQVIGAMSTQGQPSRKFVQTFILATQTNGYFVLNDIFRYLYDEDEEADIEDVPELKQELEHVGVVPGGYQEPAPTEVEIEPKGLTSSTDPAAREHDAALVDKELEGVIRGDETAKEPTPTDAVNGTPEDEVMKGVAHAEDAPAAAVTVPELTKTEPAEEVAQPEKPKDPAPSPAKEAPKPAAAAKPALPKTWAQLAGSNSRTTAPAVPVAAPASTTAPPTKPSQPQQAPAPSAPITVATPTTPAREPSPAEGSQEGSTGGWQAVGADHKRQQSRSQGQTAASDDRVRAYVRNVYADISPEELRNTLQKFGFIPYCDINRQKNSAFVEFSSRAGFQAAVAANPHKIAGHEIFVEERRVNPFSNNRGNVRPNRNSFDGRSSGQGRGGSFNNNNNNTTTNQSNKEANRGGFAPRGRGGNAAPRGRGAA